jgi:hypothetical protein
MAPIRITERDIAMFQSLSTARYLTVEELEWLHFPGWRARWTGAHQDRRRYRPSTLLYSRLQRLCEHGLIHRIVRSVPVAVTSFAREKDVYALAEDGAALAARFTGEAMDTFWYEELRPRSALMLTHAATIGRFYAALRTKIETMTSITLEGWQGDHRLAQGAYDRIPVQRPLKGGGMRTERLAVLPDAAFWIVPRTGSRVLFFVEIDRDRPVGTWRDKIAAYESYAGSQELQARYGVSAFVVLTATTNTRQQHRLMTATAHIHGRVSGRYLFTRIDQLHPLTIGAAWSKITAITPTTRGTVGAYVQIETAPYVLFD